MKQQMMILTNLVRRSSSSSRSPRHSSVPVALLLLPSPPLHSSSSSSYLRQPNPVGNYTSSNNQWFFKGGGGGGEWVSGRWYGGGSSSTRPSVSMWRRKKEMGKEGLIIAKELKRLQNQHPLCFQRFLKSHVSRLLKSDLVSILAEFQRQNLVFLSMKLYDVVRKEVWYRPDMFFYRDMLMMLARNKKVDEAKQVWGDLTREQVLFDQHTFGDLVRAFLDAGLPTEAMDIYDDMRRSRDPPLSLPYRVILKGLIPYPHLRDKVKDDFFELFPDMVIYDPPEDIFDADDQDLKRDSELEY